MTVDNSAHVLYNKRVNTERINMNIYKMSALFVAIGLVVWSATTIIFAPAKSYPVRENIETTGSMYSFTLYCDGESIVGVKTRELIGRITFYGNDIPANTTMQTNVCELR